MKVEAEIVERRPTPFFYMPALPVGGELKNGEYSLRQVAEYSPRRKTTMNNDNTESAKNQAEVKNGRKWTFTIIDNAILENESITHLGFSVYTALCFYTNKQNRSCYPKIKTLAKFAHLSESSVKRGLKELADLGIIEIAHRKDPDNPKKNLSNLYTIKGVGSERTQGGFRENPGVGSERPANKIYLEQDLENNKQEAVVVAPSLKKKKRVKLKSERWGDFEIPETLFDRYTGEEREAALACLEDKENIENPAAYYADILRNTWYMDYIKTPLDLRREEEAVRRDMISAEVQDLERLRDEIVASGNDSAEIAEQYQKCQRAILLGVGDEVGRIKAEMEEAIKV